MPQSAELFPLDKKFAGFAALSGIDEAGRGCLAGPVVVAAVTWDLAEVRAQPWFRDLADSKQIDANTREALYPCILAAAQRVRVAVIHNIIIDYLNILQATFHGFELVAPAANSEVPLVIDGHLRPPSLKWAGTQVKGDSLLSPVAAAGIVAKVVRDALLVILSGSWPAYGFAQHKGYATATHRKSIAENGACPYHRKSFRPVRDALESPQSADAPFLERLDAVSMDSAETLFQEFRHRYHLFSYHAARQAIHMFGNKGLSILPAPSRSDWGAHQKLATSDTL